MAKEYSELVEDVNELKEQLIESLGVVNRLLEGDSICDSELHRLDVDINSALRNTR